MTAALSRTDLAPVRGHWTADDLDQLPDSFRYEIVDGALHMSPSPRPRHQLLSVALVSALRPFLPDGWRATAHLDVILSADGRNVRCPDVVVFRCDDPNKLIHATDVRLVVEVVSPGSKTEDRVTKPVVYADAGISSYWRVEQEPALSLVEYQLTDLGKYYEHSPRAGVVSVDKPWPIEIDLDAVIREAGLA